MLAFDKGVVLKVKDKHLIEFPGILRQIASILNPPQGYDSYDIIVGFQGTRKTTLVSNVGHQHSGIIYVNIGVRELSKGIFARALAKALHWTPYRYSWVDALFSMQSVISQIPNTCGFGSVYFYFVNII